MQPTTRPTAWLRKFGPYALFFGFGLLFLFGPIWLRALLNHLNGVGPGVPSQMTGAEVAADAQAAGWPAAGTVTGKLITAAGFYLFFVVLRWLTQQLTHPGPTLWAKKGYTADFDALAATDKFIVYRGIRMDSAIMAAASMLAAALVQ
jgi:hypothetical protein